MLASCRLGCSAIQELARGNWPSIGGAYGKPAPAPGTRKARSIALPDRGVSWREIEDRLFGPTMLLKSITCSSPIRSKL